jgi:integrase/recombinase XerD
MGTVAWTRREGILVPFAEGYRRQLSHQGHPPGSTKHHISLMGQLSWWLADNELEVGDLTRARAEDFLATRRARGQRRVPTLATLSPLLDYLRDQQVLAPEDPREPTPREQLLERYRRHLIHDRGLTPTTVLRYERFAKRFLADRAMRSGREIGVEELASAEINDYLLAAGSRLTVESAKREAADLRAFLRFLYLEGLVDSDLGGAMPPVATWRGTTLFPTLSAAAVTALLESCDRLTVSGRREYAILVLLARLGLRAGEVAALRLNDVDWRAGELVVRGKARRQDQLPLPVEVGEALVAYLRAGRPHSEWPQLILTLYAPARPIHPSSITNVVYRACRRAGLDRVGAHRLRHALATEMLRQGGDLIEIAQVLRQSDLATTSGYAKVDRAALRVVAQPWPGADR